MGLYLVSVDGVDWVEDELLVGMAPLLSRALKERGVAGYAGPPSPWPVPDGEGSHFEEKFIRPMDSYDALRHCRLDGDLAAVTGDREVLVPVEFDGLIHLDAVSAYSDITAVASAWRVLEAMEVLAAAIGLPVELVPRRSDNLDITGWIDDVQGSGTEAAGGPWREDLDAAFYVAMFLSAAQFSIRRSCPMRLV